MTNMDKLYEAVEARGPVCVGLDTDFSYLPADFVDSTLSKGENIVRFNKKLIDATKAVAGCYKVQIAYYESLGLEGLKAYADTLKAVREAGVPVIADIKRGDIAKTAEMYAMGHFTGDFRGRLRHAGSLHGPRLHQPLSALRREAGQGYVRPLPHLQRRCQGLRVREAGRRPPRLRSGGRQAECPRQGLHGRARLLLHRSGHRRHPHRGGHRDPRQVSRTASSSSPATAHRAARPRTSPSI